MIGRIDTREEADMRVEEDKARAQRLIDARVHAGFGSSRAASVEHKWPESTYRAHENGGRPLKRPSALRYAAAFGVSADWLFSGQGKMLDGAPVVTQISNAPHLYEIDNSIRSIPVKGRAVGGICGAIVLDGTVSDYVDCPAYLSKVAEAYALEVVGSSMEPRYYAGELVYVHPGRAPRRGSFVVVQYLDGSGDMHGIVKRLLRETADQYVFEQFNPPRELTFDRDVVKAIHVIRGSSEP